MLIFNLFAIGLLIYGLAIIVKDAKKKNH
jgi:hypothetical protein